MRCVAGFYVKELPRVCYDVLRTRSGARVAGVSHSKTGYQKAFHNCFDAGRVTVGQLIAVFKTFVGGVDDVFADLFAKIFARVVARKLPIEHTRVFAKHIANARKHHIPRGVFHYVKVGNDVLRGGCLHGCLGAIEQKWRTRRGVTVHRGSGANNGIGEI